MSPTGLGQRNDMLRLKVFKASFWLLCCFLTAGGVNWGLETNEETIVVKQGRDHGGFNETGSSGKIQDIV